MILFFATPYASDIAEVSFQFLLLESKKTRRGIAAQASYPAGQRAVRHFIKIPNERLEILCSIIIHPASDQLFVRSHGGHN